MLVAVSWLLTLIALLHPPSRTMLLPGKVLLAWAEEEHSVAVRWFTDLPVVQTLLYREVCFSYKPGDWQEVTATSESLSDLLRVRSQYKHTALLHELLSHCIYEYQVGSNLLWTPVRRIGGRAPAARDDTAPVRLIVFGDLGMSPYSEITKTAIRQYVEHDHVDGIIHLGDIAYSLEARAGSVGDEFLESLSGIADTVPYMVCPGNHEAPNNFTHYKARFRMPITPENEGTNMFYSLNLGAAHVVVLSTEVWAYNSLSAAQTQANWLKRDLRSAPKDSWRLVFGHKPLYCSVDWTRPLHNYKCNINCWAETETVRRHLEPLFEEHRVDIYFGAHVHRYERQTAILHNETVASEADALHEHRNPNAPIHVLCGTGGNNHGPNDISTTPQSWNLFQSSASGFGVLTVWNRSHLLWEQYDSAREERIDYVWVIKT